MNEAATKGIRTVAGDVEKLSAGRVTPLSPLIIFLTDGLPDGSKDVINDNVKQL